jgi:hypothetical protein
VAQRDIEQFSPITVSASMRTTNSSRMIEIA